MNDPRALYHAAIIEHDRHPRHEGPLPAATHAATVDNPLCGDVVTIRFVVSAGAAGTIEAARFEARGCALSRAAASLLTTRAVGSTPAALRELADGFERLVHTGALHPVLGELAVFQGVHPFKSRRACACLAVGAARVALAGLI